MIARKEGGEAPSRREAHGNMLENVSQDSFIEMKDLMSSDGEIRELYDHCSDRDYIEFDDILTSDTASTSSGNSSNTSVTSNEYINIGGLLRDIMRHGSVPVEDEEIENVDCISCFSGPVQDDSDELLKDNMPLDKEDSEPYHHFSNGGYLELRDLFPSHTASTISGNLGCMGWNSSEYFNADELLRGIERADSTSLEEEQQNPDCHVCMKNSIRPSPVAVTGTGN
jgi:hypothetical protein